MIMGGAQENLSHWDFDAKLAAFEHKLASAIHDNADIIARLGESSPTREVWAKLHVTGERFHSYHLIGLTGGGTWLSSYEAYSLGDAVEFTTERPAANESSRDEYTFGAGVTYRSFDIGIPLRMPEADQEHAAVDDPGAAYLDPQGVIEPANVMTSSGPADDDGQGGIHQANFCADRPHADQAQHADKPHADEAHSGAPPPETPPPQHPQHQTSGPRQEAPEQQPRGPHVSFHPHESDARWADVPGTPYLIDYRSASKDGVTTVTISDPRADTDKPSMKFSVPTDRLSEVTITIGASTSLSKIADVTVTAPFKVDIVSDDHMSVHHEGPAQTPMPQQATTPQPQTPPPAQATPQPQTPPPQAETTPQPLPPASGQQATTPHQLTAFAVAFDSSNAPHDESGAAAGGSGLSNAPHHDGSLSFGSSSAAHVSDAAALAFDSSSAAHVSDAAALAFDSNSAAHVSDAAALAFDSNSAAHFSDAAHGAVDFSGAAGAGDSAGGAVDFSGAAGAGDSAGGAVDFSGAAGAGDSAGGAVDFSGVGP
jgi:hypothetical protein